ncbi:MAG TPA: 30S ribosomal protein S2 [Candidatus Pacearchaeota archaeon]|nr:30S ribosomal protein S2 [Candidatus Pacearchaeota archaeon]HPR80279.1 30S ribosomal protein S2 [Candidatus Pacearchaeota archaeon]
MEETKIEKKIGYNISVDDMIAAGLGYGHDKSKLNPKMKDYIAKQKDRVHIIDLDKTAEKLTEALDFLKELKSEGKSVAFVGTKVAVRDLVKDIALKCNSPYVTERWIGGVFTNFKEIRKRINYFKELEAKTKEIDFEKKYVKKERLTMLKELERLRLKFDGVKNMEELPKAVFIVDVMKDEIALKEARQCGIKIIALADTNINPNLIDYPIPGNDDAYTSIEYVLYKIEEVLNGKKAE